MRYLVLATDYDGTLATHGKVDEKTLEALRKLKDSGRKLFMVTGRELPELKTVFPELHMFDKVVAENGALLYDPKTGEEQVLVEPPNEVFVNELIKRGVDRISVGKAIVATWVPFENIVLDTIRDLGLELQVIFNKDAVMILPGGMNKAAGLTKALAQTCYSPHNVVGIGDAENDHIFLSMCEFSAAVENALPMLKERVDYICANDHGAGVTELIEKILEDDLVSLASTSKKKYVAIGTDSKSKTVYLNKYETNILVLGSPGAGKSTLATSFVEQLIECKYQFCVIDPEGDYPDYESTITFGANDHIPDINEVTKYLENPDNNAILNLLGVTLNDRPKLIIEYLGKLLADRAKTGRPHWIIMDETHHYLNKSHQFTLLNNPDDFSRMMFVTIHLDQLPDELLKSIENVFYIGTEPEESFKYLCNIKGIGVPELPKCKAPAEAIYWNIEKGQPYCVKTITPKTERRRHIRKYTEGELEPEDSFYFTGENKKLKLKAQNLFIFIQIAEGIDDETWLYHLKKSDYSHWFSTTLKDKHLSEETREIEKADGMDAKQSREAIFKIIRKYYSA